MMEEGFCYFFSLLVFLSSRYLFFTSWSFLLVLSYFLRVYLGPGSISVPRASILDSINLLRRFSVSLVTDGEGR